MNTGTAIGLLQRRPALILATSICAATFLSAPLVANGQPSRAAVCKSGSSASMTLDAYAYSNGWLLCCTSDKYTGGEQVYREKPFGSGHFVFVKGTGGWYLPKDLTTFAGVDPVDARILVRAVSKQMHFKGGN